MKPGKGVFLGISLLALLALTPVILPVPPTESAAPYNFTLISDKMTGQTSGIKLSNQGHLVWEEEVWEGTLQSFSLWLYRGGTKTAIPCDNTHHNNLDMNDHDQVVWTQQYYINPSLNYSDVYAYSGGSTVKLTNAAVDHINHYSPRINNLGTIVWWEWLGSQARVVRKNGGISYSGNIDGINGIPQISDRDEVVWSGKQVTGNWQIYYWHSGTPDIITSDAYDHLHPLINNKGDIVYAKNVGSAYDLYLFSGGVHNKIGSGVSTRLLYILNDQGQVAWVTEIGKLYLYSGGGNTFIGDADYTSIPGLNNKGQVAYQDYYGHLRLYDQRNGTNTELLSITKRKAVQINDPGQIAWWQSELSPRLLYLATPMGNPSPINFLLLGN